MASLSRARLLALVVPAALLLGAYGSQWFGGLVPCEMCWWQRYPHFAGLALALAAIVTRSSPPLSRTLTILAAVAILVSGAIGVFHAGVEYHWWKGPEACTAPKFTSIADLFKQKVVLCDVPQWKLWGISLAGWNAIFSLGGGGLALWWATRKA